MDRHTPLLGIALLAFCATISGPPAHAMIEVYVGGEPAHDPGWPDGALGLGNLDTRVGYWVGPPFGGGRTEFVYQGDTDAFADALAALAEINAPQVELVIHAGRNQVAMLKQNDEPIQPDWTFTVWHPAAWHRLFNDPTSHFAAEQPEYRQPVPAPRITVYLGGPGRIDLDRIHVPARVKVVDHRRVEGRPAVSGTVYDMATGKPIAGASVRLLSSIQRGVPSETLPATTDEAGRFAFEDGPFGSFRLIAAAPGHAPRAAPWSQMARGDAVVFDNVQLAESSDLTVRVVDTEGEPLEGVSVRVRTAIALNGRGYESPDPIAGKSDGDGRVTLAGLPHGHVLLASDSATHRQLDIQALHRVPSDQPVVLTLGRTGTIEGRLVDDGGNGVRGHVQVSPPGDPVGKWGGSMQTDADGGFRFDRVTPGQYYISSRPMLGPQHDRPDHAEQITVTPGETTEVTVRAAGGRGRR